MDLRQIRHFEALYRLGSFRLAAEEQGLTHSALTRSIQKLEESLGVRLFDRTTRAVHPTAGAERLLPRARALLQDARELTREAGLLKGGEAGRVSLGAAPLPTEALVPPALERLVKAGDWHAEISVVTDHQDALMRRLMDRELDMVLLGGVSFQPIAHQDALTIQFLSSEPAVILARPDHPLVLADAPSEDYLDHLWAAPRLFADDYARFPDFFRQAMEERGIPQLRLENLSACIRLALDAHVLTGAPLSVARRIGETERVHMAAFPFPVTCSYAVLRVKERSLSPAAGRLREAIVAAARALAAD